MSKQLGQALRFVRQAQGLGQEEVAEKAGISSSYVSLIEMGERDPGFEVVRKLCRSLNVSMTLLAMVYEADHPFVRPLLPLAYVEISRLSAEVRNGRP